MVAVREIIDPDEARIIGNLAEMNLKTVWKKDGVFKRGQHGKHHGCVSATFRILDDLPKDLAIGLFAKASNYECHVRFSNGRQADDRKPDAHGMAIKLLNVPGEKLLPGKGDVTEQDFLLVDHPTFFCRSLGDYLAFNRYFTPILDLGVNGKTPLRLLRAAYGYVCLRIFHAQLLSDAQAFAGHALSSPLHSDYHSTTPYLLGPERAVKYKAVCREKNANASGREDGLRAALWQTLERKSVIFDFGVIVQRDSINHPIEDAGVDWEANGASFVKLAELELHKQTNSAQKDQLAEALIFTPWMCLPEHRPLGIVNRARRHVYVAMSGLRSRLNGQKQ